MMPLFHFFFQQLFFFFFFLIQVNIEQGYTALNQYRAAILI